MNTESANMVNKEVELNNILHKAMVMLDAAKTYTGEKKDAAIICTQMFMDKLQSLLNSSTADERSVATMPNSTNVPLSPNPTLLNLWEKEGEDDIFQGCRLSIAGAYSIFKPMAKKLAKEIGEKYITPLLKEVEELKKKIEDHKRLCREIDVILFGDDAAKQPSLCDILKSVEELKKENEQLKAKIKNQ